MRLTRSWTLHNLGAPVSALFGPCVGYNFISGYMNLWSRAFFLSKLSPLTFHMLRCALNGLSGIFCHLDLCQICTGMETFHIFRSWLSLLILLLNQSYLIINLAIDREIITCFQLTKYRIKIMTGLA